MSIKRVLKWKTISSKKVFSQKWLSVRSDACQFPDGRIIDPYYVVDLPDYCNTIVVTEDEKIVLVRQYRYPVDLITLELPGGMVEKNENPIDAAKREMEEETGYVSNDIEFLMQLASNPAIKNNTGYFFLARNAKPTSNVNFDAFEDIDVLAFTKEEIFQLLNENKLQHAVQVGPMYAALVKLGWLKFEN